MCQEAHPRAAGATRVHEERRIVRETYYEWEETYFALINPTTGEPITDPNTKNEFDDGRSQVHDGWGARR